MVQELQQKGYKVAVVGDGRFAVGDVLLDIVLFSSNVLERPRELGVLSADSRREKATQPEAFAFLLCEGRRLVVARIVEKRRSREVVLGLGHVTFVPRSGRLDGV